MVRLLFWNGIANCEFLLLHLLLLSPSRFPVRKTAQPTPQRTSKRNQCPYMFKLNMSIHVQTQHLHLHLKGRICNAEQIASLSSPCLSLILQLARSLEHGVASA